MKKDYSGTNIFLALYDIDEIKVKLREEYPSFSFVSDKGDVAEAYAIEAYGLTKSPTGQTGYDALTKDGKKISIKCIWEQNQYRSIHFSGGSNTKEDVYKEADHLLVIGRTEFNNDVSIVFNGPISFLEP